ncbi:MAG: UDP-N-acetylmuramoyl-L-alanyl-D-glutamate--2,6-diaminopimelate ligase [Deltaproteobacteria bacterium]|nr:UDP-N-acetylmuramoyl-L-alanyl-D-glutamate--2,6-diaminopimelate ligase [Deltaproteobacteria bacterium]
MQLRTLIDGLEGARLDGDGAVLVRAVHDDSRRIEPGDLFVAARGGRVDGHDFVATAIARGAVAIVVERRLEVAVPQVIVPNGRRALGALVARSKGSPAAAMTMVGVTGTNGKTTTTYLIESILAAAGARPGVIGTVNYRYGGQIFDSPYTTPTPEVLHTTLAEMVAATCTHAVLEVSSAALAMDRLTGVAFAAGGFSNLTQDHLDVHGTMEAYAQAKQLLFSQQLAANGAAVINVDDPASGGMIAAAGAHRVLRVSAVDHPTTADQRDAEIRVVWCESTVRGIRARIRTPRGEVAVEAHPLVGAYNVANLALAVGIAESLGIDHAAIVRGIATLPGVPGRVERVANDADLDILVDYAHTPDALDNVLRALRPLTKRRLICVFGCGGDRDPTKRPKMGAAVAELADLAVVTSDNPRTEDPRAILDMILPAVPKPFVVDVDRRNAIRAAIAEATPGDVVVIAGKGHEDYQILGTTKIHFDDREEAAAACALRPRFSLETIAALTGGTLTGEASCTRVTIDSRQAAPGDLYVAIQGHVHDGHAFASHALEAGAQAAIVARGRRGELGDTSAAVLEVDNPQVALGQIARAHRQRWGEDRDHRLIAITGSAGKTTTKELTAAALRGAATTHAAVGSLNNETGVPLTVLGLRPFHRYGVIEMGMRGLGQIEELTRIALPDVAVVINAGTAHIELLGSTDAIAQAKGEIWIGLAPGGTVVRPFDDARLAAHANRHAPGARTLTFGDEPGADVRLVAHRASVDPRFAELDLEILGAAHHLRLSLVGRHAAIDACAALAAAIAAGVTVPDALAGLARARPAAMRGEIVDIGGRHVIVDCYNANPASMAAALTTLAELATGANAVAVVGDMLELGDHAAGAHAAVGAQAAALGVSVIALGAWKDTVANHRSDAWTTDEPTDAARQALALTSPGDWILVKASRGMRLERVVTAMREVAG